MGRKRKNKSDDRLPPYTYIHGNQYTYRPYINGKAQGRVPLCPIEASISEVWAAYEALQGQVQNTISWLTDKFIASEKFAELGDRTQEDYKRYQKTLTETATRSGVFGNVRFDQVTPGVIRRYLDKRGEAAPVQANREIAFLSAAYSWAYERDMLPKGMMNPCRGVKRNTEKPRDRYVKDDEYYSVYQLATDSPWYIQPMMEIAYLVRYRGKEIRGMLKNDLTKEGLDTRRVKGSRDALTLWSDRLLLAVNTALGQKRTTEGVHLFADIYGQPIKKSTFDSAWQRLMKKAERQLGITPFPFHDLKAKGVSDFEGNKKDASGHRTEAMVAVYDRKKMKVKPTR